MDYQAIAAQKEAQATKDFMASLLQKVDDLAAKISSLEDALKAKKPAKD